MTDLDRTDQHKIAAVTAELAGDFSGVKLEINKELVLSTGHLPSATFISEHDSFCAEDTVYGWRVFVDSEAFPPEMQPAINLAKANDCKWVLYDSDGPAVPGLPRWTW